MKSFDNGFIEGFFPLGVIDDDSSLVLTMACHQTDNRSLYEKMVTKFS